MNYAMKKLNAPASASVGELSPELCAKIRRVLGLPDNKFVPSWRLISDLVAKLPGDEHVDFPIPIHGEMPAVQKSLAMKLGKSYAKTGAELVSQIQAAADKLDGPAPTELDQQTDRIIRGMNTYAGAYVGMPEAITLVPSNDSDQAIMDAIMGDRKLPPTQSDQEHFDRIMSGRNPASKGDYADFLKGPPAPVRSDQAYMDNIRGK